MSLAWGIAFLTGGVTRNYLFITKENRLKLYDALLRIMKAYEEVTYSDTSNQACYTLKTDMAFLKYKMVATITELVWHQPCVKNAFVFLVGNQSSGS